MNNKILSLSGSLLISTIAMALVIVSITFLLGGTVANWHFPLSFATTIILYYLIRKQDGLDNVLFLKSILFSLFVIALSIIISLSLYDVSYDGQTYHLEGIYQLKNGWNPTKNLLPVKMDFAIYINHYSKGVELPQSTLYSLINRIEASKASNLILFFASLFLTLSYFLEIKALPIYKSVTISLFLTFNPIAVNQLITTYVDGQMASLLLCLFITILLVIRRLNNQNLILLGSIIIITTNIKFTGLVYIVIFLVAFLVWLLYTKKKLFFKKVLITSLFSGLVAITLVGFNPYVINTFKFGHPFYPLMGPNKVDIMNTNTPNEFQGKSSATKFLYSFFSHTDNMIPGEYSEKISLKIPFAINKKDIQSAGKVDSRIAGFGPFFSGIMIISIIILISLYINTKFRPALRNIVYFIAVIILSVCIIPESWWARYIPQLWYVPLIILFCFEIHRPTSFKFVKGILYAAFVLNIGMVLIGLGWNFMMTNLINHQIRQLQSANRPIEVQWNECRSNRIRFQENAIPYIETDLSKKNITGIIRSTAFFVMPKSGSNLPKSQIVKWAEKFTSTNK